VRRHELPRDLRDEVRQQLECLGGPKNAGLGSVVECWPQAVGPSIAANAWPARIARDGTLIVHTSSSVWAQELTQLEDELCQRLAIAGQVRMRFIVGQVPEPAPPDVTRVEKISHMPTVDDYAKAREIAGSITDPELRAVIARAAMHSLSAGRSRGPNRAV